MKLLEGIHWNNWLGPGWDRREIRLETRTRGGKVRICHQQLTKIQTVVQFFLSYICFPLRGTMFYCWHISNEIAKDDKIWLWKRCSETLRVSHLVPRVLGGDSQLHRVVTHWEVDTFHVLPKLNHPTFSESIGVTAKDCHGTGILYFQVVLKVG